MWLEYEILLEHDCKSIVVDELSYILIYKFLILLIRNALIVHPMTHISSLDSIFNF